jgi:hypothetical protein
MEIKVLKLQLQAIWWQDMLLTTMALMEPLTTMMLPDIFLARTDLEKPTKEQHLKMLDLK